MCLVKLGVGWGFHFLQMMGQSGKEEAALFYFKLQKANTKVEVWLYKWGVQFFSRQKKGNVFYKEKTESNLKLKLYNQNLERVKFLKFLVMWIDENTSAYSESFG